MSKTLKDRLKEAIKSKRIHSYLEVERQTGIKANRIYKWYQQGTNPKAEDAQILEKWLNSLEKSTNKQAEVGTERSGYIDISMSNLTESNKVLSDANKTLAEANKTLADANLVISKNHDELIQLTKLIVANSVGLPKTPEGTFGPENTDETPGFGKVTPSGNQVNTGKSKGKH